MRSAVPFAALAVGLLPVAAACGDAPQRSSERFCGEITAHKDEIQRPPTNSEEVTDLVTLYSKMGETAPLEIEADWESVYGALKTANTMDPDDPAQLQEVADAAYAAQRGAQAVVAWAQGTCGVTLEPAAEAPGAPTVPPTAPPTATG
jgi:hypothetical protein